MVPSRQPLRVPVGCVGPQRRGGKDMQGRGTRRAQGGRVETGFSLAELDFPGLVYQDLLETGNVAAGRDAIWGDAVLEVRRRDGEGGHSQGGKKAVQ